MKKLSLYLFILTLGISLFLISCGSTSNLADMVKGKRYTNGKWLTDDAYAITIIGLKALQKESKGGTCPDDLDGEDLDACLDEAAVEAARMRAQYRILLQFTGGKFKGAAGMKNMRLSGIAAAEEVGGTISNGSVMERSCDKVRCAVTYVINSKGLKNKVMKMRKSF